MAKKVKRPEEEEETTKKKKKKQKLPKIVKTALFLLAVTAPAIILVGLLAYFLTKQLTDRARNRSEELSLQAAIQQAVLEKDRLIKQLKAEREQLRNERSEEATIPETISLDSNEENQSQVSSLENDISLDGTSVDFDDDVSVNSELTFEDDMSQFSDLTEEDEDETAYYSEAESTEQAEEEEEILSEEEGQSTQQGDQSEEEETLSQDSSILDENEEETLSQDGEFEGQSFIGSIDGVPEENETMLSQEEEVSVQDSLDNEQDGVFQEEIEERNGLNNEQDGVFESEIDERNGVAEDQDGILEAEQESVVTEEVENDFSQDIEEEPTLVEETENEFSIGEEESVTLSEPELVPSPGEEYDNNLIDTFDGDELSVDESALVSENELNTFDDLTMPAGVNDEVSLQSSEEETNEQALVASEDMAATAALDNEFTNGTNRLDDIDPIPSEEDSLDEKTDLSAANGVSEAENNENLDRNKSFNGGLSSDTSDAAKITGSPEQAQQNNESLKQEENVLATIGSANSLMLTDAFREGMTKPGLTPQMEAFARQNPGSHLGKRSATVDQTEKASKRSKISM